MFGDPKCLFLKPQVLQKERSTEVDFQDKTPLVDDNNHLDEGLKRLQSLNLGFDLKQCIQDAGHQVELCVHVKLTFFSCVGYLHMLGRSWKDRWKKYWFVFNHSESKISYYNKRFIRKWIGDIKFESIKEVCTDHSRAVKSPDPQSAFCVKTCDRIYYLMAPTPETMRIWVDVIFSAM